MIDLPDNSTGPYTIIQIVSGRNVQMLRETSTLGEAEYLHYLFSNPHWNQFGYHYRLIQSSDLPEYKRIENENNQISRSSDNWPHNPRDFPVLHG